MNRKTEAEIAKPCSDNGLAGDDESSAAAPVSKSAIVTGERRRGVEPDVAPKEDRFDASSALLRLAATPAESATASILADLSCLIPGEDDDVVTKAENYEHQADLTLARFAMGRNSRVGWPQHGRGRVRGRGATAQRGFAAATDESPSPSRLLQMPLSLMTDDGITASENGIMRCRLCSKPFKRRWSLQVHELLHHQPQDGSIPEHLALSLSLTDSIKRKMGTNEEAVVSCSEYAKRMRGRGGLGGRSVSSSVGRRKAAGLQDAGGGGSAHTRHQQLLLATVQKEHNNNSSSQFNHEGGAGSTSPARGASDVEENNNDTTSQSSEAASLSMDVCSPDSQAAALQHTPMFGGITVPSLNSFRELRRQVSLARRTCKFCGKVCFKPSDLQRHLMKHTGERPFSCSQCGRRFKAKRSLLYHQRASHGAVIELSPALEDKFAQTKKYQKMLLQVSTTTQSKSPVEVVTDDSSVDSNSIAMDSTAGHSEPVVVKSEAGSSSDDDDDVDDDDLTSGMSDSDDDELGEASGLTTNGLSNGILQRDVAVVEEEEEDEYKDDENHVPSSEKLNADVAALIPAVPTEPEDNTVGEDDSSEIVMVPDKRNGTKPPTATRYKVNLRSEEVIATRLEGINSVTSEKVFLYKCHLCGKVFSVMSKLQNHLTVHLKRHKKQYSCSLCGEVFKMRSQWVLHSRTHQSSVLQPLRSPLTQDKGSGSSDVSPVPSHTLQPAHLQSRPNEFNQTSSVATSPVPQLISAKTSAADVAFREANCHGISPPISKSSLTTTASTASGLPPLEADLLYSYDFKSKFKPNYACSYCGKYFDRPFSLQRHERMHTGVKPCYCKDCGRGFSEPRNLRHHIIRFHSDGSLHHLLRRNRCKEESPAQDNSGNGRLMYFGRNNLLKKSVEYFLNSSLPKAAKPEDHDDVPPTLEEMVPLIPKSDDEVDRYQSKPNLTDMSRSVEGFCNNPPTLLRDGGGGSASDNVTVVIPTDVSDDSSSKTKSDFWQHFNPKIEEVKKERPYEQKEVMTDPKRSLIGNRRKQHPRKLVGGGLLGFLPSSSNAPLKTNAASAQELVSAVAMNALLAATSMVDAGDEHHRSTQRGEAQLERNSVFGGGSVGGGGRAFRDDRWQTNMTVASLLAKERGLELPPQRSRSRGRSTFFSSYSPRLDVVQRPVARMQACKPQLSPDGKMSYSCCYCNKMFCSASDLNRHMDFHEDVRPFKCQYCEYYSRTNSQLKVHMMRHEGIKQFQCQVCNYTGVTQSDLNRHCKTQAHCIRCLNTCICCGLGFFSQQQRLSHQAVCRRLEHRGGGGADWSSERVGSEESAERYGNGDRCGRPGSSVYPRAPAETPSPLRIAVAGYDDLDDDDDDLDDDGEDDDYELDESVWEEDEVPLNLTVVNGIGVPQIAT